MQNFDDIPFPILTDSLFSIKKEFRWYITHSGAVCDLFICANEVKLSQYTQLGIHTIAAVDCE